MEIIEEITGGGELGGGGGALKYVNCFKFYNTYRWERGWAIDRQISISYRSLK